MVPGSVWRPCADQRRWEPSGAFLSPFSLVMHMVTLLDSDSDMVCPLILCRGK